MKKVLLLVLSVLMLMGLPSCTSKLENKEIEIYESLSDLNGKKIGVMVSTTAGPLTIERFPDSEVVYFNTPSDAVSALLDGKIDVLNIDKPQVIDMFKENRGTLTYFDEPVGVFDFAYCFPKTERGQMLCNQINEYLHTLEESGELDRLNKKWLVDGVYEKIDYHSLENINGELKVAIDNTTVPFSFVYNNDITGFDVEFLLGFAKAYGYSLTFDSYEFAGAITATSASKVDIAASGVMITEERKKSLLFSDPFADGEVNAIYRKENAASDFNNLSELASARIASVEGSSSGAYLEDNYPDVKVLYFASMTDLFINLTQGKVDALTCSSPIYDCMKQEFPQARAIGSLMDEDYGFGLNSKGNQKLKEELNEFIAKSIEDGTLDNLYQKWTSADTSTYTVDKKISDTSSGTINVGIASQVGKPFCLYQNGDDLVGLDVEFLYEFARAYHYDLVFTDYSFLGTLTALTTGKIDIAACGITITEERKQSIDFSDPYKTGYIAIVTNSIKSEVVEETFIDSLKQSFNNTFVVEDRYKLFIDGIIKTINITLISIALGTLFGFGLFAIFRLNNKFMNAVLKFYAWLITGMPTVVLLMVLFYIVFASVDIDATLVAIIAFTIIFSITILGLLKMCFASINKGQYEAAYALGYNKLQTFFKITLPQVAPIFLPSYKDEVVSLIKSSSVVGYIAVQDLTKISDIVRSRTYDAFFPLIATTIIYFMIAGLFKAIISLIQKRIDPKARKRSSILLGVKTDD